MNFSRYGVFSTEINLGKLFLQCAFSHDNSSINIVIVPTVSY